MGGLASVFRFEICSVLRDRRFVFGLSLQMLLVLLLVPLLMGYVEKMSRGYGQIFTGADGLCPVAEWTPCDGRLEAAVLSNEEITVRRVPSREKAVELLEGGRGGAAFGGGTDGSPIQVVYRRGDPRSAVALEGFRIASESYLELYRRQAVEEALGVTGSNSFAGETGVGAFLEPIRLKVMPTDTAAEDQSPAQVPSEEGGASGSGRPQSSVTHGSRLKYLFFALGLTFPTLSAAGIALESITGEKELGLIEGVLAAPVSRWSIITGKYGSALTVSLFQSSILAVVLGLVLGVRNILGIVASLSVCAASMVAIMVLLGVVSMRRKESALAATVVYVVVFAAWFIPALLPGELGWASPISAVTAMASGRALTQSQILVALGPWALISLVSLVTSFWLFQRDDVVFGPRPSVRRVLKEAVAPMSVSVKGRLLVVCLFSVLATVPSIIMPLAIAIPLVGVLGSLGLAPFVAAGSFVEEYFKPYGVYLLPKTTTRQAWALGMASGLCFSFVENLLYWVTLGPVAGLDSALRHRYMLSPLLHMAFSGIVAAGYSAGGKSRIVSFLGAAVLHTGYNLSMLMEVL